MMRMTTLCLVCFVCFSGYVLKNMETTSAKLLKIDLTFSFDDKVHLATTIVPKKNRTSGSNITILNTAVRDNGGGCKEA